MHHSETLQGVCIIKKLGASSTFGELRGSLQAIARPCRVLATSKNSMICRYWWNFGARAVSCETSGGRLHHRETSRSLQAIARLRSSQRFRCNLEVLIILTETTYSALLGGAESEEGDRAVGGSPDGRVKGKPLNNPRNSGISAHYVFDYLTNAGFLQNPWGIFKVNALIWRLLRCAEITLILATHTVKAVFTFVNNSFTHSLI